MLRVAANTLYILKYFKKKNRETYTVSEQMGKFCGEMETILKKTQSKVLEIQIHTQLFKPVITVILNTETYF